MKRLVGKALYNNLVPQLIFNRVLSLRQLIERNVDIGMMRVMLHNIVQNCAEWQGERNVHGVPDLRERTLPIFLLLEPGHTWVRVVDVNREAHQVVPNAERDQR